MLLNLMIVLNLPSYFINFNLKIHDKCKSTCTKISRVKRKRKRNFNVVFTIRKMYFSN